jgi:hypothetical protein
MVVGDMFNVVWVTAIALMSKVCFAVSDGVTVVCVPAEVV